MPEPDLGPRAEAYIRRLVAEAPLPTPEQRDRLTPFLRPVTSEDEASEAA